MEAAELYNNIMGMLTLIRDDKVKLNRVLTLIEDELLDENESKKLKLPEKYRQTLYQITEEVDAGFAVFLNPDTLEMEIMSNPDLYSSDIYGEHHEDKLDEFDLEYYQWERVVKIEPPNPDEIYRIMEDYVNQYADDTWRTRLEDALAQPAPAEAFQEVVSDANIQKDWQDFKKNHISKIVINRLLEELPLDLERKQL